MKISKNHAGIIVSHPANIIRAKLMQVKEQESEYVNPTLPKEIATVEIAEPGNLATVASTDKLNDQVSTISRKISIFLERLPHKVVNFVNEYQLLVVSFAALVLAVIVLNMLLAITNALNDIPLVASFFELIGFCYVTWFVYRYFLKAVNRQELAGEIDMMKRKITDENAA
jgi:CAAD domains of cyanobacterial aminoacyl-tRNA synthetase